MAKLTVYFRDAPIQSGLYDGGTVRIGRNGNNDLVIDSLAVAPNHVEIQIQGEAATIKQLDEDFPLMVNGIKAKQCDLHNNDKISLGKHTVLYNVTEANLMETDAPPTGAAALLEDNKPEQREASLQVMGGQYIGRLIPLKKAMTRLGTGNFGVVVISKRKDGYFISALDTHPSLKLNNQPLGDSSIKLNNNDRVVIDNTPMLFFYC